MVGVVGVGGGVRGVVVAVGVRVGARRRMTTIVGRVEYLREDS